MSAELFDIAIKAGSFILSVAAIVYAVFANRRKYVDERFDEGARRMTKHDARIGRLEQAVQTMPGKDDTHRLEMMLVEMAGDMKAIRATMRGMSESLSRTEGIVGRHEDHLREKG